MLVIGSRALVHNNPELAGTRKCGDWDFIATIDQFNKWYKANKADMLFAVPTDGGKYYHCRGKDGMNYEFEIAWEGTSARMLLGGYGDAGPDVDTDYIYALDYDLLAIKMSHRYKKNSVHFKKCMDDIRLLRSLIENYEGELSSPFLRDFIALREKETYTYSHPALNVDKSAFFKDDGVQYVYDHDSIHEAVALEYDADYYNTPHDQHLPIMVPRPAYTLYAGGEVWSSSEKFFNCSEQIRLYGVYEETCVLALERSQIPHGLGKEGGPTPRWSFEMALMKVCTSITSGWFRSYAWESYDKVMSLYNELGENDYINRFKANRHLLRAYNKGD
jgi:hypothetical protein